MVYKGLLVSLVHQGHLELLVLKVQVDSQAGMVKEVNVVNQDLLDRMDKQVIE